MTTATVPVQHVSTPGPVRALAALEAKRYLRRVSLWIGAGLTVLLALVNAEDWSSATYLGIPINFGPLVAGTFLAAVRTGSLDRGDPTDALAAEAQLGPDQRALARLLGLASPLAIAGVLVAIFAVAARIEGGYWIGDSPWRTDTAQHSALELAQPLLLVLLAGAAGVAWGRLAGGLSMVPMVGGLVVWFALFGMWWACNIPPGHAFTPVQVQPVSVDLPGLPAQVPDGWLIHRPTEYDTWQHVFVHLPTVAGHTLYLAGLVALCSGAALRGARARRLVATGAVAAGAGLLWQFLVYPW